MASPYRGIRHDPLTKEEIEQRYKDIQEELQEVMDWKAEEEKKLDDPKITPPKKGAANRALKKVARRIDTVNGQIIYWKMRVAGDSHFRSSLEMNEYWASCREKEMEKPEILKK